MSVQLDLLVEVAEHQRRARNPQGDPFLDHPSCLWCAGPASVYVVRANRGLCHRCVALGRALRASRLWRRAG